MSLSQAIAYVEGSLGTAQDLLDMKQLELDIANLYTEESGYVNEIRRLEAEIGARKDAILTEYSATADGKSVAQQERELKLRHAEDEVLKSYAEVLRLALDNRDICRATIEGKKTNHKGYAARLVFLGGYLNMQAVAKQADIHGASIITGSGNLW